MKYLIPVVKQIFIQFTLGTIIEVVIIWVIRPDTLVEVSDTLFICASAFLFLGPIFLKPKELGIPMQVAEDGQVAPPVEFESTDLDETLIGLSEEEQKRYLLADRFIVFIRTFGIGITLFFYSIFLPQIFGI